MSAPGRPPVPGALSGTPVPARDRDGRSAEAPVLTDAQHATGIGGKRNGAPEPVPYRWRNRDREREEQVRAEIAAARAWLAADGGDREAVVPDLARPADGLVAVGVHHVLAAGPGRPVRPGRVAQGAGGKPAAPPARPVLPPPVGGAQPPGVSPRCDDCGYLLTALGHRAECGDDDGKMS
jgi:hypothetical protein